jgi:hypothetical protein
MTNGWRPLNLAGLTGLGLSVIPWSIMFLMEWLQPG